MRKLVLLVIALLIVTLISGCGLFSKTIKTDEGSVKVNDNGSIEVKNNKDNSSSEVSVAGNNGEEVSLPSDYPKDLVPIIDDAKVTAAMRNEDANKKVSYLVTYTTGKTPKEAYDYYLEVMKGASDLQKFEMNGTYTAAGALNNKLVTLGVVSQEEEGQKVTTVSITIADKQ